MIKVNKPINLYQLDLELNGLGLNANLDSNKNIIEVGLADNNLATENQLQAAIDAHVAKDEKAEAEAKKLSAEAKLAALGLTTEDLKALGLN